MHLWLDPFEWTIPMFFTTSSPEEMKEKTSSGMRKTASQQFGNGNSVVEEFMQL
jgi:hypothetical protein